MTRALDGLHRYSGQWVRIGFCPVSDEEEEQAILDRLMLARKGTAHFELVRHVFDPTVFDGFRLTL